MSLGVASQKTPIRRELYLVGPSEPLCERRRHTGVGPPAYRHAPAARASSVTKQYGARVVHPDKAGNNSVHRSRKPHPILMWLTIIDLPMGTKSAA